MPAYRLGGLRILSDVPLFGLPLCGESTGQDDVVIRRGAIPEELASTTAALRDSECIGTYNGKDVLIDVPEVARFLVRGGKEIVIEAAPLVHEDEIRVYLLGTVFGLLCHQRGILPLHAAAIDVAGGCVAFVGASHSGKSTLAAALAARGHQVIADDVCFQQLDDAGRVKSWPGLARIRLWEEAMHALGCDGPGVVREMHGYNKFFIPVPSLQNPVGSRPLRRVYALQPASDAAPSIIRLHGAAGIEVLMQNVYRLSMAEALGYKPHVFRLCAGVASNVSVFRFSRPLGFDVLDAGIDLLEEHLGSADTLLARQKME
jgi:hypothetical protein